jgi:predicted transcriptional regulator
MSGIPASLQKYLIVIKRTKQIHEHDDNIPYNSFGKFNSTMTYTDTLQKVISYGAPKITFHFTSPFTQKLKINLLERDTFLQLFCYND